MLKIKNLTKKFNDRLILDNVSLRIETNEILSIVGPSGGGKTTLLRCISGLETMDSGEIWLDDEKIDFTDKKNTVEPIGVVFQEFNLFPHLSVLENITLAPQMVAKASKQEAEQEANRLLDLLGLIDKKALFPFQLSGGQKQRVAIARALAMKPKVLCYDEPTSALDPDLKGHVETLILSLKQEGLTQIVVTHDHAFAKNIADQLMEVEAKA